MNPEMHENHMNMNGANKKWIIPAVAIGAAIGITYAATHHKKSRWETTRRVTEKMLDQREDLAEAGKDLIERIQTIYHESRVAFDQIMDLWGHGRKLIRAAT